MKDTTTEYRTFLESKVMVAAGSGLTAVAVDVLHPSTKPHQADSIVWGLRQGRALLAMSFGLGKTHIQIEMARLIHEQTGKRFLVVCPLGVKHQFQEEDGPRLGVRWVYVRTDAEVEAAESPYLITNYERVRDGDIDPRKHDLGGMSLDEGSVLRSLGSKTSQIFKEVFADVPYRYVCTATPAPNQFRELIYYAEFLGVMDHGQALTRWFKRDPQKAGNLTLHPNHEKDFWLWVSTWALFLYKPSDLGYDDAGYDLPELRVHWHRITVDHSRAFGHTDNRGQHKLLLDATSSVSEAASEKRATLGERIEKMVEIVRPSSPALLPSSTTGEGSELSSTVLRTEGEGGRHWLIWHHLEDERRAIEKALPEAVAVYGAQAIDVKEERILGFSHGRVRMLATKPELSGFGCNFQYHCHSNVFLGVDYKFEDFIQSIHRTYRFQQEQPVDVHIIYAESEERVVDVLKQKWQRHEELSETMREIVRTYGLSQAAIGNGLKRKIGVGRGEVAGERFRAINNDCVLEMPDIGTETVELVHTSIPFGNHYEYTVNVEDFGHNADNDKFFEQMDFLIPELLRVLKPGRLAAIHVKDRILYGHQTKSGFMSVDPFSDLTVAAFMRHGFLYQGRRTIVTDVVRENNSTYRLGWSEMCKDASKMGSGLPEYLLLFRKPPTSNDKSYADEPVTHAKAEYSRGRWQIDAHAFWRSNGNVLIAKELYDYAAHVGRLEKLDEKGNLPASFFCEPPKSGSEWVWDDIVFMQCLNANQAGRKSENHICPLPLDIVERTIRLYSNPGDVVLDPFAGLFTVPYMAIQTGRIGVGIELNTRYWEDGARYCQDMEQKVMAPTLFDVMNVDNN